MHVFSKSARCPNNEIPSCEKACTYGISDIPMPKSGSDQNSSFLCSQVMFLDKSEIQLHLELSVSARNLSTPIHTLLMPTFLGLNLGI